MAISVTNLRPPWRLLARAVWVILSAAAVGLFLLGTLNQLREPPVVGCGAAGANCPYNVVTAEDVEVAAGIGLPAALVLGLGYGGTALAKLPFIIIGVIIFWRRSDDWVALLLALTLMLWTLEGVYALGPLQPLGDALYQLDAAIFFIVPLVFPTGRLEPRWVRWIVLPFLLVSLPVLAHPSEATPLAVVSGLWFLMLIYAVVYRYRHVSTPTERQQTKWVIAGFLATFAGALAWVVGNAYFPASQPALERLLFMLLVALPLGAFSYLFLCGAIGFAILRYRLWDIDLIIRRTLIYSVLTVLLALTYFGLVLILQGLVTALGGRQAEWVTVASTLAVAALILPLRNRVQAFIDQRFFRRKYNATNTLAAFAAVARDETDLNTLTGKLAGVVQETMEPESVSVWIKPAGRPGERA